MVTRQQIREQARAVYQMGYESAAKAPAAMMPYGPRGSFGPISDSDESVHDQQYKYALQGWPFASIRPIATRIAAQTLRGVKPADVKTGRSLADWQKSKLPGWLKQNQYAAMEPVTNNRLLNAVAQPNDLMVEWMLMWCTAFSIQATGRAWWWFSESGGRVRIWPVPTHWVKRTDNAATLRIEFPGDLDAKPVPAEDMVSFYFPNASNPLGCMSPLQASAKPILVDAAIKESQHQGFGGGHLPTMVAVIGEKADADGIKRRPELTEDQRLEIESRLLRLHGGSRNHGRIGVVDGLITDFKRLSMAPTEMDYLASSKMTKSEIQNMFGVSPVTMGELENANRASSYVADENFLCNVVNPLLEMMGQVLTSFSSRSRYFKSDPIIAYYDPIVARDSELEKEDWQFAYDRAVISDDEFRVNRLSLAPKKEGGDHARISFQFVPVKVDGKPEVTPMPDPLARSLKEVTGRAWSRMRSQNESKLATALTAVFQKQVDLIAADVAAGQRDVETLLRGNPIRDEFQAVLMEQLRAAAYQGAGIEESLLKSKAVKDRKAGIEDVLHGLSDRVPPYIEQYIRELLAQSYWQDVLDGIEPRMAELLGEYQTDGLTSSEMADRLREDFAPVSIERAQRIAVTEQNAVMNAGAYSARMELADDGLVTGHQWNSILDDVTRGMEANDRFDHVEMDGQRVGLRQMFNVDGEMAPFPGHYSLSAANRISCRCFCTAVTIFD